MNPLLALPLLLPALAAHAQTLQFIQSGSLKAAQEKAQETGKIIFVDERAGLFLSRLRQ